MGKCKAKSLSTETKPSPIRRAFRWPRCRCCGQPSLRNGRCKRCQLQKCITANDFQKLQKQLSMEINTAFNACMRNQYLGPKEKVIFLNKLKNLLPEKLFYYLRKSRFKQVSAEVEHLSRQ